MKTKLITAALLLTLNCPLLAQTADDYVSQGRGFLSATNIVAANNSFSNAVVLSPTHQTANVLYAITRLLVLPSQPVGSNFLNRLDLPATGRDIYSWSSVPPKDTNGLVLAPDGVNANEFTAQLRTNVLWTVSAAINNLAFITDTNFTLHLTSSETAMADVTVDFGDLKMIQAGLYAAEYFIYTLNAQNLDAQLTAIRALYTNGTLSASQMLADYPQLFTFATTNDLQAAQAAFVNAVNCYMKASAFIRTRPSGAMRLFNYDAVSAQSEGDFRLTLQDLENSLVLGPQILWVDYNLAVDLTPQFSGSTPWRSLLPKFDGNAVELGSLPDTTFDGAVYGLSLGEEEGFMGKYLTMLPVGRAPSFLSGEPGVTFTTLSGHYYVLEASTDMLDWQTVTNFLATDTVTSLVDSLGAGASQRFYRLRDDTGFMTFSGVVLDQDTGLPIAGAQVYSDWDGTSTYADANGQFYLRTSMPSSWGSGELAISAPGYGTVDNYFYGNGLVSGLQINLLVPPPNDNFANRTILTGSNVSTNGNNTGASWESGEPYDAYSGYGYKSVWFSWTAPATHSYLISVSTTSVYYPILAIYTGSQLPSLSNVASTFTGGYYASYTISAVAGHTYQIEIDDYYGNGGDYTLSIAP